MSGSDGLMAEAMQVLTQGIEVLRGMDEAVYKAPCAPSGRSRIGSHFRHCLDFFGSFLRGLHENRIDYTARERDERVETSIRAAIERFEITIEALRRIEDLDPFAPLIVRGEDAPTDLGPCAWTCSSVGRELQFLLSHTIHHYALIAVYLRLEGVEPGDEFGVAPSTLAYWRRGA